MKMLSKTLAVAAVASILVREEEFDASMHAVDSGTEAKVSFVSCMTELLSSGKSRKAMGEKVITSCPDAGKILGALAKGIQDAGFLEDWGATAMTFTMTLTVPHLYGEIASASKVPVMWKVNKEVVFKMGSEGFDDVSEAPADVEGLEFVVPQEALKLYKKAMEKEGAACTKDEVDGYFDEVKSKQSVKEQIAVFGKSCMVREMAAAYELFNEYYGSPAKSMALGSYNKKKKDNFGVSASRGNSTSGKITSILAGMSSGGATGIWEWIPGDKWPTVFYSMITSSPSIVETMTFTAKGVKCTTVKYDFWEGEQYDLYRKSDALALVGLFDAKAQLSMAEKAAKSGMAFAEMVAWGAFPEILTQIGFPHMGKPDALMNMFSYCADDRAGLLEVEAEGGIKAAPVDPTCRGSTVGRVSWGSEPSPRFL